jgi:hypothetical protein
MRFFLRVAGEPVGRDGVGLRVDQVSTCGRWLRGCGATAVALCLASGLAPLPILAQTAATHEATRERTKLPPRVVQAKRFLAQRGWISGELSGRADHRATATHLLNATSAVTAQTAAPPTWQPLGPGAVLTPNYGLVTGRVSALALDPADATGNHLFAGTTGGGVWVTQNAAVSDASQVVFTPLTDGIGAASAGQVASISIGALTVQPGGTGVILAGTGDPNDALDSYYGAGVLRSADGGNSWTLIANTADSNFSFVGEGFAGFAWSSVNSQLVVAAVSQSYEGTLVNAQNPDFSYAGLYYSTDSGATWNLATITDGGSAVVQGPGTALGLPDGNAATSVVWNPVRQLFVAAVRFHGYYQSADGVTWTRMSAQPGVNLTAQFCPSNAGGTGSIDCPIFRGTLAVNPQTGDTFAWTVDAFNQDQGLWQDACAIAAGVCGTQAITFAQQWNTQALESSTIDGAATIADGDYNLALAAAPVALGQGADTWLLAGANDLWKCSLAAGCVWRNTTNASTCMSAQVAEFQHALEWNTANPVEIFVGNDSGLWRSLDAIGETGPACAATDAAHFQNMNGSLGSLAEVVSMAGSGSSPYAMMTGLGVNGTAGVKNATAVVADWPQILGGYGGPVASDPLNNNWYVNDQGGVSIYLCTNASGCSPADFGTSPVVSDADTGGDGDTMASPAPFMVDPASVAAATDPAQLLIGTCRVWRGPANGVGWSGANAISPILDSGATGVSCNGDALIRSMAALPLGGGGEVVYVGMYGSLNGGANLPGHVLSATVDPASTAMPAWQDLTLNPVTNSPLALNQFGVDISSIFVDSHDPTGNTVYVTVEGFPSALEEVQTVYGSTDGGAHWASLISNLPQVPVSGVVVDPESAKTVYVATDQGVYFTTDVATCATPASACWSEFGTGLPVAPVVELSASPAGAAAQVLTAGTYGRGVWQTPLWSAGGSLTTAAASPSALTFSSQVFGTTSSAQTVTLSNTGTLALTPTAIAMSGDFSETDNCQGVTVAVGGSCSIQVEFTPAATGSRTGQMTVSVNVYGGQLTVTLSGIGAAAGAVTLTPATINFGQVETGTTSPPLQVAAANSGSNSVPITSIAITPPFILSSNSCGTSALAADTSCQMTIEFVPAQTGAVTGSLTLTDGAGIQTVTLNGSGAAPPTDILSPNSVAFATTAVGQVSAVQTVLLTNTGDLPLTAISASSSGAFQISSNTCTTQLTGHSACSIGLQFAPSQLGAATGVLNVSDALRTQTVALSGTGVQPAALSVSPTSLTFAAQAVGVASAPMILTISDTGGVAAANVGFQITGAAAASFATGTTTCGAFLASGGSCTVQVIFTPGSSGGSAASLIVSSATLGVTPLTVPLNGSGQAASGLNVSPAQLTFAATVVGASSVTQTVTVSNSSNLQASQLAVSVTAGFALTQNTCPASLAAGASCTVGVAFEPTVTGPANGSLTVTSASLSTAANVTLGGTGAVASGLTVTPANITFATTGVGLMSSATTVMVTNIGAVTALSNLTLEVPAGFELVNNTCATSLGPGSSCTAGVEFAPTAAGALTGSLTVTSSTLAGAVSVPLAGEGFDFMVSVSGAGTQSVAAGQSASYTLVLTPLQGSSGTFSLACGALPSNVLCAFNPTTETLNSGATGNVAVTVSTGSSAAAARVGRPSLWGVFPLVCGVALLPMGWKRRRRMLAMSVLLAILMSGVVSCTGSGGGTGGGGAGGGASLTPAGTYSIPVTVTSTGVSHSATVTLTVD